MEVKYRAVPADKIAMELGAPLSSNLALLGFFSAFESTPVTHEDLRQAIDQVTPERFKEINFKVFDAGFERGTQ
jgi:indolepyruvate ferredoxin oxidoreductase beta subunit